MQIRDTKELGAAIRAERKRQGITQADLAGLSDVGITYLSQLEKGKESAEIGKALNVVATLGLDVFIQRRD